MNTKFAIDYIPSQDEIDFLKVRGHVPTLAQAAFFIVSSCCKTSFEKQEEALLELKETNDDEPYKDTTVFQMIDEYIERSHLCLEELQDKKDTSYYTYTYKDEFFSSRSFRTLEDCKEAALKEFELPYNEKHLEFVRIEKNDFEDEDYYNSAVFGKDENGQLKYFHMRNFEPLLLRYFDNTIPYPFRVGDVIKSSNYIALVYELPCEANNYTTKMLTPTEHQYVVISECTEGLYTFEYCKALYGKYKILGPIGRYLRGEIYIDDMLQLYEKERQNQLCEAPYYI